MRLEYSPIYSDWVLSSVDGPRSARGGLSCYDLSGYGHLSGLLARFEAWSGATCA